MRKKEMEINGNRIYPCFEDMPRWVTPAICGVFFAQCCFITVWAIRELIKYFDIVIFVMIVTLWSILIYSIKCVMIDSYGLFYFDALGLHVKFPLQKWLVYPWSEFQEISVIYSDPVRERNTANTACICFVRKGAKRGQFTGKWIKSFRNLKKVFMIGYDEEALNSLRDVCPFDVPDLRNTLKYKLF